MFQSLLGKGNSNSVRINSSAPGTDTDTSTGSVRKIINQIEDAERRHSQSNTPTILSRNNSISSVVVKPVDTSQNDAVTDSTVTPTSVTASDAFTNSLKQNNDSSNTFNTTSDRSHTNGTVSTEPNEQLKHSKRQIDYILSNAYDKLTVIPNIGQPNNDKAIEKYIRYLYHTLTTIALQGDSTLITDVLNTCKVLYLTSTRLAQHAFKSVIQHQIVVCIATIISHGNKTNNTTNGIQPYGTTLLQQLIASLARPDNLHDNNSVIVLQNALQLLASLTVQLKSVQVTKLVLPALVSRFSVNTRFIDCIVKQLSHIAVDVWTQHTSLIEQQQSTQVMSNHRTLVENEFDSIILLLLRAYSNCLNTINNNNATTAVTAKANGIHSADSKSAISETPVLNNKPSTDGTIPSAESVSDLYQLVGSTSRHPNAGALPNSYSTSTLVRNNTPGNVARLNQQQLNELSIQTNKQLISQIPYAIYYIAEHIHHIESARKRLLIRLIRLCNDIAIDVISQRAKHELIVNMLPSIAVLMNDESPHYTHQQPITLTPHTSITQLQHNTEHTTLHSTVRPHTLGVQCFDNSEKNIKWFRRFWYYVSVFDITQIQYSTIYSMSLIRYSLQMIAAYSPVLLMTNQLKPLNSELELSLQRCKINDNAANTVRSKLTKLLPRLSTQLQQYTTAKLVFLYALYTLENARGNSKSSHAIQCAVYYRSDHILNDSDLKPCTDAISDMIYTITLQSVFSYQPTYQQRIVMTLITNQLLLSMCSRYALQRATAGNYLHQLTSACTQLQYSQSLELLITLYSRVYTSLDTTTPIHITDAHTIHSHNDKSIKVELSDLLSDRQSIIAELQRTLQQWTVYSSEHAPKQLQNIICQYWHKNIYNTDNFNTMSDLSQHQGLKYVLSVLPVALNLELMATLQTHQHYYSTVSTLQNQHTTQSKQSNTFVSAMIDRLNTDANTLYTALVSNNNALATPQTSVSHVLYTAAALLGRSSRDTNATIGITGYQQQQLLHIVVLRPLQLFDSATIHTATDVWSWLCSWNDTLTTTFYVNLYHAWKHTVDNRMGLFSHTRLTRDSLDNDNDANGIVIGLRGVNDDIYNGDLAALNTAAYSSDIGIHSYILDWLQLQCTPLLHGMNRDVIKCIYDICLYSLQQYKDITTTPHAFGCQVRLFHITLNLLHHALKIPVHDKLLLRTALYNTMLHTYSVPASWYTQASNSMLQTDVTIANNVLNMLRNEPSVIQALQAEHSQAVKSNKSTKSVDTLTIHTPDIVQSQIDTWSHQASLLQVLVQDDIQRIKVWNTNADVHINEPTHIHKHEYKQYVYTAWQYSVRLAIEFTRRFEHVPIVKQTCIELCQANISKCVEISDSIPYLITEQSIQSKSYLSQLTQYLVSFVPTSIPSALKLLLPPYNQHQPIVSYALYTLRQHSADHTVYYISQLVQLLRHDVYNMLSVYVRQISTRSVIFSHQFIWIAQAELGTVSPNVDKSGKAIPLKLNKYQQLIQSIVHDIIASFTPLDRLLYRIEFDFFEQVTSISGVLKPLPTKDQRKQRIRELLSNIHIKPGIYMPINPKLQVKSIIINSGTPMQSAAKVPILVAFKCVRGNIDMDAVKKQLSNNNTTEQKKVTDGRHTDQTTEQKEYDTPAAALSLQSDHANYQENSILHVPRSDVDDSDIDDVTVQQAAKQPPVDDSKLHTTACIFKVGDDTRQDALALQIMSLCQAIWQSVQLPLYVYPYRVVPTSTGSIEAGDSLIGGVIECIPNASTRDEIGKATACSLHDYYLQKFGPQDSPEYQRALMNFIHSIAGYSIISYILQVKDRHNGNIMIDGNGYSLHIDFGFIFDISPANNLKFEKAGFKLTYEMVEMLGGVDTKLYQYFTSLIIRGMLAIRQYADVFDGIIYPMTYSDLACFRLPTSASDFHARLFPHQSVVQSIHSTQGVIQGAYDSYRTNIYDLIQNRQQQIYYWNKQRSNEQKQADE